MSTDTDEHRRDRLILVPLLYCSVGKIGPCMLSEVVLVVLNWPIARNVKERTGSSVRLPALVDLYIHHLYVLVSKILSSILNSSAPIHPLYHPLSTLSTVGLTCHFI
jgi:hypothetical protein